LTDDRPFAKRLRHIVTRADLAIIVTPTYAAAMTVDEEEAHDRLTRAVADPGVMDDLYFALEEGLAAQKGPRTEPDALLDKLSQAIGKRRGRVAAADANALISAVMVRINLAIGLAPEAMRGTLASDKGRAMVDQGLRAFGGHVVKELLK
jgi:hypothetical protein